MFDHGETTSRANTTGESCHENWDQILCHPAVRIRINDRDNKVCGRSNDCVAHQKKQNCGKISSPLFNPVQRCRPFLLRPDQNYQTRTAVPLALTISIEPVSPITS